MYQPVGHVTVSAWVKKSGDYSSVAYTVTADTLDVVK